MSPLTVVQQEVFSVSHLGLLEQRLHFLINYQELQTASSDYFALSCYCNYCREILVKIKHSY